MNAPFHERRRQQFVTEGYADAMAKVLRDWNATLSANLHRDELGLENISLEAARLADNLYSLISLHYTAGEPIEPMRAELEQVIAAYERFQKALEAYEQIPQITAFSFGELGHYERCMQLIGLCYLLHRRDLLPRIAALQDPGYAGEDTLYEDLLSYEIEGRYDVDAVHWKDPYEYLIKALYVESDDESADLVKTYVQSWYPAFKYVPWHDGHLRIEGNDGDYFGYWAFEAGAVAHLLDLDDSAITHMVYPKDLVAWARANKHLSESDGGMTRLRCEANQPCPREGFWFTPAQANSRRFFKAGEVMPEIGTDYGATIWQWDSTQDTLGS